MTGAVTPALRPKILEPSLLLKAGEDRKRVPSAPGLADVQLCLLAGEEGLYAEVRSSLGQGPESLLSPGSSQVVEKAQTPLG